VSLKPTIIPSMLYHDAPAAIAWLERAFDFKPHLVRRAKTAPSLMPSSPTATAWS